MGERIGVFGGTFDPPHVGHLVLAVNVRHALALDKVLLVVANDPWQKLSRRVTPAPDRLAMVEAAVGDVDGLEASAIELERGEISYTADTLSELRSEATTGELFLVLGSDAAAALAQLGAGGGRPRGLRRSSWSCDRVPSMAVRPRVGNGRWSRRHDSRCRAPTSGPACATDGRWTTSSPPRSSTASGTGTSIVDLSHDHGAAARHLEPDARIR